MSDICSQCGWDNDPYACMGQCIHLIPEPERQKLWSWTINGNSWGTRFFEVSAGWRMLVKDEEPTRKDVEAPSWGHACGLRIAENTSWGKTEETAVFLPLDELAPGTSRTSRFDPTMHFPVWRRV